MTIDFEIIFTDADGNHFRSKTPPSYLYGVLAGWMNVSRDEAERYFPNHSKAYFEIDDDSIKTAYDIIQAICTKMSYCIDAVMLCRGILCIYSDNEFISICDNSLEINHFWNPEKENILTAYFVFSVLQGDIWREDNIRYYMNSNEQCSHHLPHVHIIARHEFSATIDILNGEILEGKLPGKYRKKVLDRILNNKEYLVNCWNMNTNGLKVDINHGLGITKFDKTLRDKCPLV